ncbi:alpha-ketoacid dehydrogenase subunit beta [Hujiaoplasma nucleasis]|uniref:Alpha-ketoacid dehydrogenase subunit beta n=1 Tax=Hujiaoplasma nucleasis TaxID=2725268 RepID=A0A7L6N5D4_9MOLU|nr:alpha-ketoacid dehydrogenase subunit beta [Hujiaoplasma nucleasis]QLY40215.1 alpha-ketoacid dehydrogenase subunit beta [Hujiaoplasma nucleasis]
MAVKTILQAINEALDQAMEKDESVVVYGEDVGFEGGVFRTTAGLQKKYGEGRVFDTPIAEAAIAGSAVGMAINGLKPVVEMQFSGFSLPAYNQVVTHVARFRNRSRGKYHLPMVIRMPYGGGVKALEHHSESLETLYAHIPGLKLVIPSTPYDAKGLTMAAINDPDPVIIMEPKRIYRAFKQDIPDEPYEVEIGKARMVKEGKDITIIAWGALVREVEKAMKTLDVDAEIIDLRTIAPMDTEAIIKSVKKTGRVLVVHEAYKSFGPAAEIISRVNEEAFFYLEAAPRRLAGFDVTVPLPKGEGHFIISPEQIAYEVKKLMAEKA